MGGINIIVRNTHTHTYIYILLLLPTWLSLLSLLLCIYLMIDYYVFVSILLTMISFCYHKFLIFYYTLLTLRHSPTPTFSQPPPAASLPPTPRSAWPTAGRSASPRAATSRACRAARDRARGKQRHGGRDATPRVGAVGLVLLGGWNGVGLLKYGNLM